MAEGNVGGGTGMVAYGFKGGIGTVVAGWPRPAAAYTVGVLVQANFGRRAAAAGRRRAGRPRDSAAGGAGRPRPRRRSGARRLGSIIIVVATDAPLLPHQLKRLARRATLGMARTGGLVGQRLGRHLHRVLHRQSRRLQGRGAWPRCRWCSNEEISPIFDATAQATEEAIINAMVAAETMVGADGRRVERLPHDRLREALKKYNRLAP